MWQVVEVIREISTHTLTWSVTVGVQKNIHYLKNFNSHAHVERDLLYAKSHKYEYDISTHTLTWSVTLPILLFTVSELFQLTRSRGA